MIKNQNVVTHEVINMPIAVATSISKPSVLPSATVLESMDMLEGLW